MSQLGPKKVDFQSSKDSAKTIGQLKHLDERFQEISAQELKALSLELEAEAGELADAGDYEAASDKLKEAYKLQHRINRNYTQSPEYDAGRAIRLQIQEQNYSAEPLSRVSLDSEQQAYRFLDEGNLDAAVKALKQAIAVQRQLNSEYREARQVSILRLEQLKTKLAEVESSEPYLEIEAMVSHALSLQADGKMEEAGGFFEKAVILQEQFNKDFPDSPYASLKRIKNFQIKSQIAQSAVLAQKIEKEYAELERLLAARSTKKAEQLIEELNRKALQFEEDFPLSSAIDETLKTKVGYLYQTRAGLATIQDQVYKALLPLPGSADLKMLRTEVPQNLYQLIVGANPSRNQADKNPVDSVSWIQAKVFCERLSWVLGKKARLPTEKEFRQALGDFKPSRAEEFIWGAANANGLLQPVGQKKPLPGGYFDLLGNASEWLDIPESGESKEAQHMGGHAQDSFETILRVPVRKLSQTERSRFIGFRPVVLD